MSQFEAYEKPEEGVTVSIQGSPEETIAAILAALDLS